MRVREIGTDIDLDGPGAASGSAIDHTDDDMPFKAGATVVAVLTISAFAEAEQDGAALALEGREETTDAWETLAEIAVGVDQPMLMQEVVLKRYSRWTNNSATAGDGRGSIYLLGN